METIIHSIRMTATPSAELNFTKIVEIFSQPPPKPTKLANIIIMIYSPPAMPQRYFHHQLDQRLALF